MRSYKLKVKFTLDNLQTVLDENAKIRKKILEYLQKERNKDVRHYFLEPQIAEECGLEENETRDFCEKMQVERLIEEDPTSRTNLGKMWRLAPQGVYAVETKYNELWLQRKQSAEYFQNVTKTKAEKRKEEREEEHLKLAKKTFNLTKKQVIGAYIIGSAGVAIAIVSIVLQLF